MPTSIHTTYLTFYFKFNQIIFMTEIRKNTSTDILRNSTKLVGGIITTLALMGSGAKLAEAHPGHQHGHPQQEEYSIYGRGKRCNEGLTPTQLEHGFYVDVIRNEACETKLQFFVPRNNRRGEAVKIDAGKINIYNDRVTFSPRYIDNRLTKVTIHGFEVADSATSRRISVSNLDRKIRLDSNCYTAQIPGADVRPGQFIRLIVEVEYEN